ncbi:glycosyltransferase family 10 domain-containing protein [uncultured Bacteroides sp.]|uniref:glycosyltransferase family 10 domain-containing protein n=1 Tax=uncultured Bacteroides sp. TaxID=162156 RepID=UPI002AAA9C46|nr:glycosyltransferase family 10 [uncultured Bacteroides sp.]
MYYVNILTPSLTSDNWFLRQLDIERYSSVFSFYENSELDIVWDLVIVYEGINVNKVVKHKKGGLLFISGEPPMSSVYTKNFLDQFDCLLTAHPKLKHKKNIQSQQALPWHFGKNFNDSSYNYNLRELKEMKIGPKTKNISVITSSKTMMPGHNKRIKFLEELKNNFPGQIDFYGKGINPVNDKADAILPYRFHLCIENSEIPNYWTEKLADPILGLSIPIYIGCTNISDYFPTNSFYHFSLERKNEIFDLIEKILYEPEQYYSSKIELLKQDRTLILDKYNIFPVIENLIASEISISHTTTTTTLQPDFTFSSYNILLSELRFKRWILKHLAIN